MSLSQASEEFSPEIDARLSQLLEHWAAPRRLTQAQADSIRKAVLSSSGELGYEWWHTFLAQVAAIVTEPSTGVGSVQAGIASATSIFWQPSPTAQRSPGSQDAYRLYLRLV